jgi:hypothetical protein
VNKLLLPALLAVGLAGCAVKPDTGSAHSSDVLTAEEIQEVPVTTAYDAVRRLRPSWLRVRSAPTARNPVPERPVVYIDGVRSGSVGILRNIRRNHVVRIEYLGPSDATNRFGTGHSGGALLVSTG